MNCLWSLSLLHLVTLWANAALITENGLPILWDQASSQLSDLPQADNVVTVNPWNYLHRMSLYRIMLSSTNRYMGSIGSTEADSPLWGLPLQLGWKLRSGRLVDPTGATTCGQEVDPMCISAKSWWSCVNHHLLVVPFLAGVRKGVIGDGFLQVQMQAPAESAEVYCISFADCSATHPDLMTKWENFFDTLKNMSESEISDFEKRDQILGAYWAGQQQSLKTASSSCKEKMSAYSSPEVLFANNWMNSADYVAATYFLSNINNSVLFMSPLPSRVLKEGDSPPNIADLSSEENHTLYMFDWMNRMNRYLFGSLVKMWRSAMCSDKAREKGRELLQDLVQNPKFAASTFLSILTEMVRSC
ncbi:hypothetical protein DPEC_G00084060 [Dallia pectoralis]|uniref:Uncharacterized protein n=1 Tax=Dallia pectoralis TaxID=75939 RepID=A0ACC2H011_DALPE|nr:hypothetical protein DPEC_G00084060 [Dallia pectoralis]